MSQSERMRCQSVIFDAYICMTKKRPSRRQKSPASLSRDFLHEPGGFVLAAAARSGLALDLGKRRRLPRFSVESGLERGGRGRHGRDLKNNERLRVLSLSASPGVATLSLGMPDQLEDHHQAVPRCDTFKGLVYVNCSHVKRFATVPCPNGFFQMCDLFREHSDFVVRGRKPFSARPHGILLLLDPTPNRFSSSKRM